MCLQAWHQNRPVLRRGSAVAADYEAAEVETAVLGAEVEVVAAAVAAVVVEDAAVAVAAGPVQETARS